MGTRVPTKSLIGQQPHMPLGVMCRQNRCLTVKIRQNSFSNEEPDLSSYYKNWQENLSSAYETVVEKLLIANKVKIVGVRFVNNSDIFI